jgi:hypothetical protein
MFAMTTVSRLTRGPSAERAISGASSRAVTWFKLTTESSSLVAPMRRTSTLSSEPELTRAEWNPTARAAMARNTPTEPAMPSTATIVVFQRCRTLSTL